MMAGEARVNGKMERVALALAVAVALLREGLGGLWLRARRKE